MNEFFDSINASTTSEDVDRAVRETKDAMRKLGPYNAGDRYEIRRNDEPKHEDYPSPCFDVWDNQHGKPAMLPNAVLCWCLVHNDALDALLELRGGEYAEALRS